MIKYRKALVFVLIFLAPLVLVADDVVEAIVAIVNDDIITLTQYKAQHEELYQTLRTQFQGDEFTQRYELLRKELLDTMITELLLLQEAQKMGFNVSEQVAMTIENIKKENNLNSDEELKRALLQQGIDFDAWKKHMEQSFMKQGVIYTAVSRSIVIDDTDIVNYFNRHQEEFREPAEYVLKAIYISTEGKSEEEVEVKKGEIDDRLSSGEDFSALAGQYSEGPEKDSQGDLGSFKEGELAVNLRQAVQNVETGETTPWIQMPNGWYLLKLADKKESRLRTFEESRKEIEQRLFAEQEQKKLKEFLTELKAQSYIKILMANPLGF
jgi:parvulin-like peptidyl-prolyl isomerase